MLRDQQAPRPQVMVGLIAVGNGGHAQRRDRRPRRDLRLSAVTREAKPPERSQRQHRGLARRGDGDASRLRIDRGSDVAVVDFGRPAVTADRLGLALLLDRGSRCRFGRAIARPSIEGRPTLVDGSTAKRRLAGQLPGPPLKDPPHRGPDLRSVFADGTVTALYDVYHETGTVRRAIHVCHTTLHNAFDVGDEHITARHIVAASSTGGPRHTKESCLDCNLITGCYVYASECRLNITISAQVGGGGSLTNSLPEARGKFCPQPCSG